MTFPATVWAMPLMAPILPASPVENPEPSMAPCCLPTLSEVSPNALVMALPTPLRLGTTATYACASWYPLDAMWSPAFDGREMLAHEPVELVHGHGPGLDVTCGGASRRRRPRPTCPHGSSSCAWRSGSGDRFWLLSAFLRIAVGPHPHVHLVDERGGQIVLDRPRVRQSEPPPDHAASGRFAAHAANERGRMRRSSSSSYVSSPYTRLMSASSWSGHSTSRCTSVRSLGPCVRTARS